MKRIQYFYGEPNITANLYFIYLSTCFIFTYAIAVHICGNMRSALYIGVRHKFYKLLLDIITACRAGDGYWPLYKENNQFHKQFPGKFASERLSNQQTDCTCWIRVLSGGPDTLFGSKSGFLFDGSVSYPNKNLSKLCLNHGFWT